jgi:uncharacterized protein DUF5060/uncharacterized protein DUF5605/uncharacterized protein DUF4038
MIRNLQFTLSLLILLTISATIKAETVAVAQWDVFEITLHGPSDGNPFLDVKLSADFTSGSQSIHVPGFYDGEGNYRIRFMPAAQGTWHYQTRSNRPELAEKTGDFVCTAPADGVHGPARVQNTFHFAYADGTPFIPIGTTCYGWIFAPQPLEDETLKTLKSSPFNKVRMCILPTPYTAGKDDPIFFPFERKKDGSFDLTRFDPKYFQHVDECVSRLRDMGIEADVILFHPYNSNHLDFDRMDAASDDRYARYVVARLAADRNVWWSMANEYDLIRAKRDSDWDRLFQIVQHDDPFDHLRSIHFSQRMYDPDKPWITHMSVQNGSAVADFGRADLYRDVCAKPVVYDEVCYEGNVSKRWGQLSGEEMTLRFWMGTIAGTYVGHGEAIKEGDQPAWISSGGLLHGQSSLRIAFLKQILSTAPPEGIEPIDRFFQSNLGGKAGEYYLLYFGREQPAQWTFELPQAGLSDGMSFNVDILDTWNMSITPVDHTFKLVRKSPYEFGAEGDATISLPGKPYIALRIRRIHS